MKIHSRHLLFATCLAGLVFVGSASAAVIKSQATCAGASGFCLEFSGPGTTIPVIRAIAFIAPSAGTAAVSFMAHSFAQIAPLRTRSSILPPKSCPAQARSRWLMAREH